MKDRFYCSCRKRLAGGVDSVMVSTLQTETLLQHSGSVPDCYLVCWASAKDRRGVAEQQVAGKAG